MQPSNTTAGAAITPAVTVKIEDQFGNVVTSDSTDTVTVGIASGPGGASFAGTSTLTVTANTGVATFNNLRLNTAGSYTLSETASGGLTGPASNSFTVTPAAANQLVFGVAAEQHHGRGGHHPGGDGQDRGPVRQPGEHRQQRHGHRRRRHAVPAASPAAARPR